MKLPASLIALGAAALACSSSHATAPSPRADAGLDADAGCADSSCGDGFACRDGACAPVACDDAGVVCGHACSDLAADVAHCGSCGHACAVARNATTTCTRGECRLACATGWVDGNGDLGGSASDGCELSAPDAAPSNHVLDFDASFGQYLLVPRAPSLEPSGSFTIEVWLHIRVPLASLFRAGVLCKPVGAGAVESYEIWLHNPLLEATVGDSTGLLNDAWLAPAWHHLALVYDDAARSEALLVDATPWAGPVDHAPPAYDAHDLLIGVDSTAGALTGPLDGWLDDVRIWATVRTPGQILADMSAQRLGPAPGLQAEWTFDEGSGAIAHDTSGNGNDALFESLSDAGLGPSWAQADHP